MQIGNFYSSYDNHIQDNTTFEGTNAAGQSKSINASGDISNLKEGSVFRGEILEIMDDRVTIKLQNQLKLLARLQGDVQLGIGDQMLFSVKENNASQILIKPMFDSLYSAETQVLEKALDMASLSPTEKNFLIAKKLMEAGQPLDRGSITHLLSQSMKFPETSIDTLVSLNKMNIPVTAETIAQYQRYEGFQHQLSTDIGQTVDSMVNFGELFPENVGGSTLLSFAEDIISTFVKDMPKTDALNQQTVPTEIMDSENMDIKNTDSENTANIRQEILNPSDTAGRAVVGQLLSGKVEAEQPVLSSSNPEAPVSGEPVDFQQNDQIVKDFSNLSGFTESESTNFLNAIQKTGVSQETITNIIKNSDTPEQALQHLIQAVSENAVEDTVLMQLLDSHEFKKLFGNMIHKSWSLNPKDMKDPKEIDDMYERIQKQSNAFEHALASKGGDAKGFQQSFQNMRQNLSFMEQINHQMIYAQMPLKLSNQNANSELYVYADKRKLMEKKDGISVMLHLDMDHLGHTDIKVTLTGSNVHARFYLNDEESVELVSKHIPELAKQLGLRGFSLTDEVVKRKAEESINKVIDEIIDENAERSIKRYTFDART